MAFPVPLRSISMILPRKTQPGNSHSSVGKPPPLSLLPVCHFSPLLVKPSTD